MISARSLRCWCWLTPGLRGRISRQQQSDSAEAQVFFLYIQGQPKLKCRLRENVIWGQTSKPKNHNVANCLRFQVPKGLGYVEALAANSIWRYAELTPLVWPEQGEAAPRVGEPPLLGNLRRKQAHGRLRCTSHPPTKVWDAPATAQGFDAPATRRPRIPLLQPPPNQGFRCTGHPATNPSKIFVARATPNNQDSRCSSHPPTQPPRPRFSMLQPPPTKVFNAPRVPATWVWKFSMLQPPRNQDFRCSEGSCNMGLEIFDGVPELQSIECPFP